MKTKEELTVFLEKELSYDASVSSEYRCKKCGHHEQELSHWIDHKSALVANISYFLGFKGALATKVREVIDDSVRDFWEITGDPSKDAPKLAARILADLGEEG